ncbi:NYN domain-containing protein [Coraliomargarita parva]|uniref:NYN domain-containing protein n=1 Tax=Coraliomargarita parva TaxID=3014050 RepID=UPI0022B4D2E1|nr:NYN domain-containing protein [Coraliomargarita parva]
MANERYLLIDAYNVICATAELREQMHGQLDTVRDLLAERVRSIHDAEGIRVALILDSRNDRLEVEYPYGKKTFEYLYAPAALTADGVIERIVRRAPDPGDVTVVSNDNLVREAVRSSGAIALRPEELYEWTDACERKLVQDAARRNRDNASQFKNSLEIDLDL